MKGGEKEKENLTEIIWKLEKDEKLLSTNEKKIVNRITDGYTKNKYNLTEKDSLNNWFIDENYFRKVEGREQLTRDNKGVSNKQHLNKIAEPTRELSILKILKLAKPNIPDAEINNAINNAINKAKSKVKKKENIERTSSDNKKGQEGTNLKQNPPPNEPVIDILTSDTQQLQASSDPKKKVTIDELLIDMHNFQEKLGPLVDKSSTTYQDVTNHINKLLNDIKTGKDDSDTIIKLKEQNEALQGEIEQLTNDKRKLEQEITQQTQKSGETAQQISEKENEINQLKQNFESEKRILENKVKEEKEKMVMLNQKYIGEKIAYIEDYTAKENEKNKKIKELEDEKNKLINENNIQINNLTKEKQELQQKLEQQIRKINDMELQLTKVTKINEYFKGIKQQTTSLVEHNDSIKKFINKKNKHQGGYQYKSKNKTRSKRMLKLNRFGLLKSKSKTRKGKKKLKVKKNKKSVKGGMKTRSKPKRKSKKGKKTRKGKKKNNKRK